jgi:hypothetical protein
VGKPRGERLAGHVAYIGGGSRVFIGFRGDS